MDRYVIEMEPYLVPVYYRITSGGEGGNLAKEIEAGNVTRERLAADFETAIPPQKTSVCDKFREVRLEDMPPDIRDMELNEIENRQKAAERRILTIEEFWKLFKGQPHELTTLRSRYRLLTEVWRQSTLSYMIWIATRPGVASFRKLREFSAFCVGRAQDVLAGWTPSDKDRKLLSRVEPTCLDFMSVSNAAVRWSLASELETDAFYVREGYVKEALRVGIAAMHDDPRVAAWNAARHAQTAGDWSGKPVAEEMVQWLRDHIQPCFDRETLTLAAAEAQP